MNITLSAITVYPVKAIRGVPRETAMVETAGLRGDRRWVIVDADGRFISQRTHARLALVRGSQEGSLLLLEAPGAPPLRVDAAERPGLRLQVRIWKDTVDARAGFERADTWLSSYLGQKCRLAFMDARCRRPLKEHLPGGTGTVSFADGYPCLLASEASLADLNARMAVDLPMDRFRPNLVVAGCGAFAEDGWRRLAVGEAEFAVAGPCARCSVTTVDQDSGRSESAEPLRTLATFRCGPDGVEFGVNLTVIRPGRVAVGQPVTILD
jgi:uncharacterized protein YcbX